MDLEVDQILDGKYRIVRLIGRGGMGAVYEGMHTFIDRRVAIKVLLPTQDATAGVRFEQEARAAGRIGNDHILEVFDIGTQPDGSKYMVTEFLDGEPLASRIERSGRLSEAEVVPIALQLLSGLAAAHRAGVIHRDLKPDNVFLLREKAGHPDFVKIIDFGISKFSQLDSDGLSMTKTGMLVGTPYYMSPEQARGKGGIDARADIYAVGVMLYECLSGRVPFEAESFNDLLFKVVLENPLPLTDLVPGLDAEFAALAMRGMAREPNDRFQTADEFHAAIAAWAESRGVAMSLSGRLTLSSSGLVGVASRGSRPSFTDLSPEGAVRRAVETPSTFGASGAFAGATEDVPLLRRPVVLVGGSIALALLVGLAVFLGSATEQPEILPVEVASAVVEVGPSPFASSTSVDPSSVGGPDGASVAPAPSASAPGGPGSAASSGPVSGSDVPEVPDEPAGVDKTSAKKGSVKKSPSVATTPAPTSSSGGSTPPKKKLYFGY